MHARHAEHFLVIVETAAAPLKGPDGEEWCFRLDAEQDNLRAALVWARDHDQPDTFVRFVHSLELYRFTTGESREAYEWHHAALEYGLAIPAAERVELLGFAGHAANGTGRVEESNDLCRASIDLARDAGLPPMPIALQFLGITALESNDPEEAISYCEEAVAVARKHGDQWTEVNALQQLAMVCSLGGEPERGRMLADEALTTARRLGNAHLVVQALW